MGKAFIFHNKKNDSFSLFGSLKELYKENESTILKSKSYLYQSIDFDLEDYKDENCTIMKRTIIRSKQNIIDT